MNQSDLDFDDLDDDFAYLDNPDLINPTSEIDEALEDLRSSADPDDVGAGDADWSDDDSTPAGKRKGLSFSFMQGMSSSQKVIMLLLLVGYVVVVVAGFLILRPLF